MAGMVLKSPELALEKQEADALAQAISEVEKHYSVTLTPETRAWLGLAGCCAMIYGPRAYMIHKRRKEARAGPKPQKVAAPVVVNPATPPADDPNAPRAAAMSMADFGM